MTNPWSDPQFNIVTAMALGGLWMVLRPFLRRSKDPGAGCPSCTTCSVAEDAESRSPVPERSGLVGLGSGRS